MVNGPGTAISRPNANNVEIVVMNDNYLNQLLKIAKSVEAGSGVQVISVAHDDWCHKLKDNKKKCNCHPDVTKQVKE